MMAGFGAKVKLTVDRSSTAKAEFNQQINDYIKEIKISNKFKVLKKDINRVVSDTQNALNDKPLTIKVKKIDCSAAVKDLQGQLQAMVNSLSIKNGVKIAGLVDPTGVGNVDTQLEDVNEELKKGASNANKFAGEIKAIKTLMGGLDSLVKKISGDKNVVWNIDELKEALAKYREIQIEANNIIGKLSKGEQVSDTDIAKLEEKILATQNLIAVERQGAVEAQKTAASESKQRTETIMGIEQEIAALKKVDTSLEAVRRAQEKWTKAKHGVSASDYNDLSKYVQRLEQLREKLLSGKMTLEQFQKEINEINKDFLKTSANIKALGNDTNSLGDKFKGLVTKFTKWFSVSQIIMAVWRAMKQMVSVVIEVDTAMTELRKVTDETEAAYSKFLDTAGTRAKAVGATLTDTITATADFARLGHDIDEASSLADAALVYKNVGDGIEDIAEASESVISVMQAFGVSAKDAMQIVDKFNAVGNNFAISSGGVGEAMLRSAAAMKAANNTLDETIALAAAANTIVQDPQKVGKRYAQQCSNALKEDSYIG